MTTDLGECSATARFIARFAWARFLLFVVSLLAALIVLQELIALVAHQIPSTARPIWLVAAKLMLGALMLRLYCGEVQYFERRNVNVALKLHRRVSDDSGCNHQMPYAVEVVAKDL